MASVAERLQSLPNMFQRAVAGRVLVLDGDVLAYHAANKSAKLSTALRKFQTLVETERFLTGAASVQVHLTPRGCTKCGRYNYPTVKVYQGNRKGKAKPPMLEPLRSALPVQDWPEHWEIYNWYDREADDGMMMHSLMLGDSCIVSSQDKDLRITPAPYWDAVRGIPDVISDRYGWVDMSDAGKCIGHGTAFFWAQMIMGDTADNVAGLTKLYGKRCGAVAAHAMISGCATEDEAARAVLDAYAYTQQDVLAEAQCLWLRRSDDDCAYKYISSLDIREEQRAWLDALHEYHNQVLQLRYQEQQAEDE